MTEPRSSEEAPRTKLWALALRDALLLGLALTLAVADAHARALGLSGPVPWVLGTVTGASITLSAFHAHEWGHYLGARLAGARPRPAASLHSVFLFELGEADCTKRQFLAMSAGGYAASLVALAVIVAAVDLTVWSGRVTVVLVGLGLLATFALEIPITVRAIRRVGAPPAPASR